MLVTETRQDVHEILLFTQDSKKSKLILFNIFTLSKARANIPTLLLLQSKIFTVGEF